MSEEMGHLFEIQPYTCPVEIEFRWSKDESWMELSKQDLISLVQRASDFFRNN